MDQHGIAARVTSIFARARAKATINASYASHSLGKWVAHAITRVPIGNDEHAEHLAAQGYAVIPPDDRIHAFVHETYTCEMKPAWDAETETWRDPPNSATYKLFLSDVCERWPNVLSLLDGRVATFLHAWYGARFQYSYVEPYRTFPAVGELPKSWRWHNDAVAPWILKLMVYLNGATAQTGALRVLDHERTREMSRIGFRRRSDSERFAAEFEQRQTVLEGPPGTSVVIDNRVLHKATAPTMGFRDVVCFQILPSISDEHTARKGRSRSYAPTTPQFPLFPRLR
jgi:hypothetical protein